VTDNSRANQNWKQIPVNAVKRGKTRVAIGFGITMIGWKGGASFRNQSWNTKSVEPADTDYFGLTIENRSIEIGTKVIKSVESQQL